MEGGSVLFLFIGVAGSALHGGDAGIVGKVFTLQIGMAGCAGKRSVNRGGKFLAVHEQRDGARAALCGHRLVAVTGQAVVVRYGCRAGENGREDEQQSG
jgi:hypothetical protein